MQLYLKRLCNIPTVQDHASSTFVQHFLRRLKVMEPKASNKHHLLMHSFFCYKNLFNKNVMLKNVWVKFKNILRAYRGWGLYEWKVTTPHPILVIMFKNILRTSEAEILKYLRLLSLSSKIRRSYKKNCASPQSRTTEKKKSPGGKIEEIRYLNLCVFALKDNNEISQFCECSIFSANTGDEKNNLLLYRNSEIEEKDKRLWLHNGELLYRVIYQIYICSVKTVDSFRNRKVSLISISFYK